VNPFDLAPLTALIECSTPEKTYFKVEVLGSGNEVSKVSYKAPIVGQQHRVPVVGLYNDFENKVQLSFFNEADSLLYQNIVSIKTGDYGDDIEIVKENKDIGFLVASNYQFGDGDGPSSNYIFDNEGRIRSVINFEKTLIKLKNGNYLSFKKEEIIEVTLIGQVVRKYMLPSHLYAHHDILELPNGNLLVAAGNKTFKVDTEFGELATGDDLIIELNRSTGEVINQIDLRNYLDVDRAIFECYKRKNFWDWAHVNGIVYSAVDQSIVLSVRNQGLIKLSYPEGDLKWILAPHIGFENAGLNGDGELNPNDYLLTAVDRNDKPYPKEVQRALEIPDNLRGAFHWAFGQHTPQIVSYDGRVMRLLMYNNQASLIFDDENKVNHCMARGNANEYPGYVENDQSNDQSPKPYSLMQEIEIDEQKMTVKETWGYSNGLFGTNRCSSNYYPSKGFYSMYSKSKTNGKFSIVNRESDSVLFEAKYFDPHSYRMYHIDQLVRN